MLLLMLLGIWEFWFSGTIWVSHTITVAQWAPVEIPPVRCHTAAEVVSGAASNLHISDRVISLTASQHKEAMADHDNSKDWLASASKEIRQLESKGVWIECKKSGAKGQQIIPCAWVSRCKRNPASEIMKCKARICLRGDLMEDDSNTCAPVVQSPMIKSFITVSSKKDWIMTSVDWVNAFPQAKLKKPVFMHTPRGFGNKFGKDGSLKSGRSVIRDNIEQ